MSDLLRLDVEGGKYTVIQDEVGHCRALRYGEPWLDITCEVKGQNLLMALAHEVAELRKCRRHLVQAMECVPPRPATTAQHSVDYTNEFKVRMFDAAQAVLYPKGEALVPQNLLSQSLPLLAVLEMVTRVSHKVPASLEWKLACDDIRGRVVQWVLGKG